MNFYSYPLKTSLPDLSRYFILSMDGPVLSGEDKEFGIILLDGTWRYAGKMFRQVEREKVCKKRRLPSTLITAYPRRQEDCPDPERGLASVEALYASYIILKRNSDGILDHYHWKRAFLEKNIQNLVL